MTAPTALRSAMCPECVFIRGPVRATSFIDHTKSNDADYEHTVPLLQSPMWLPVAPAAEETVVGEAHAAAATGGAQSDGIEAHATGITGGTYLRCDGHCHPARVFTAPLQAATTSWQFQMRFLVAGPRRSALRACIAQQAKDANVSAALGSRFSVDVQGTTNESFHRVLNNVIRCKGGTRDYELLSILVMMGMLGFNGAPSSSKWPARTVVNVTSMQCTHH